jgi:titin
MTLSNVPAGSYTLSAAATDNLGATSASSPVNITVSGPAIPAAPANLVATSVVKKQANLAWTDNAGNESGFRVYRSNDGRTFSKIATLSSNTTSYSNGGLAGSRTYYYQVTAYNAVGESAPSNTVVITTPR